MHKTMQAYMDTLHAQHKENQTSPPPCCRISTHSMDRTPQSYRTGSMDIEIATAHILTESHVHI